MADRIKVLIHGTDETRDVPGLRDALDIAEFRCVVDSRDLEQQLPWADVLLGWDFRADDLAQCWGRATGLRWIHWCGAGVDALLFDALVDSDVVVTNARGAFDEPMAEYVLGLVIAMAKEFRETFAAQQDRRWHYRATERIAGKKALVVGVGSIGRAIARMLRGAGMSVSGVGRRSRGRDPDFGTVYGIYALEEPLAEADYVVLVTPLTESTRGLFDAHSFAAMKPGARFINVGRGALIDAPALEAALTSKHLAGAALDVFETEPLPPGNPLWTTPNLIVSPHMSGDTHDYKEVVASQFVTNLRRYSRGDTLHNVVDKALGFVPG